MSIAVVTNLYPSSRKPYHGIFVKTFVEGLREEGAPVKVFSLNKNNFIGYLFFYVNTFVGLVFNRYSLVYVHYVSHSSLPVIFARFFVKFNLVVNFHGSDAYPEIGSNRLKLIVVNMINKIAVNLSNGVVVPSEYFREKIVKDFSVNYVHVSPSGGVSLKSHEYVEPRGNNILYAGRMIKEKRAIFAVKLIERYSHLWSGAVFIGDGPESNLVEKEITDFRIKRMGMISRENLAHYMSCSDIFLFPSIRVGESLGLVVIEAIFSGAIPLTFDNGAMREIISPEYHDILIAKSDLDYERNFVRLLRLPKDEKLVISVKLFEYAKVKYSNEIVMKNIYKLISDRFMV